MVCGEEGIKYVRWGEDAIMKDRYGNSAFHLALIIPFCFLYLFFFALLQPHGHRRMKGRNRDGNVSSRFGKRNGETRKPLSARNHRAQ